MSKIQNKKTLYPLKNEDYRFEYYICNCKTREVAHVMGDHLEMEIKYDDLGDLLLLVPAE